MTSVYIVQFPHLVRMRTFPWMKGVVWEPHEDSLYACDTLRHAEALCTGYIPGFGDNAKPHSIARKTGGPFGLGIHTAYAKTGQPMWRILELGVETEPPYVGGES